MRQMSDYREPPSGGKGQGGHTSLLLLVGIPPSSTSPLLQTCEHACVKNTHTLSSTYPPHHLHHPLVLIIPLQIRRSISSCIIVLSPPLPTPFPSTFHLHHLPMSSPFRPGERSCPLSLCQPRRSGSSGSHITSEPIGTPRRGRVQLGDGIP